MDTQTLIDYVCRIMAGRDREPVSNETKKYFNVSVHENKNGELAIYCMNGYIQTITKQKAYAWIKYERKFKRRDLMVMAGSQPGS